MLGSTIIHAPNLAALQAEADRLLGISNSNEKSDCPRVELDRMLALDFSLLLTGSGESWSEGPPAHLDEEGGLAIVPISKGGLDYILGNLFEELDETQHRDLRKLRKFVETYGKSDLYEISTF